LVETISQDVEGIGDDDRHTKNGERYQKLAEEANTMIMEVEGSVLMASINN